MTPTLVLITDPRWSVERIEEVIATAATVLPRGALCVQLRDKSAPASELARVAGRLRAATARVGAHFVVNAPNDEVLRIVVDVGADGAHVPCTPAALASARMRLGAGAWLSIPAHVAADLEVGRAGEADAVLVSPIFATPGKGAPRGVDALREARTQSGLPVLALGGVDESNARACASAGAHGVAVIRALLDAVDVARVARALYAPFESAEVV